MSKVYTDQSSQSFSSILDYFDWHNGTAPFNGMVTSFLRHKGEQRYLYLSQLVAAMKDF